MAREVVSTSCCSYLISYTICVDSGNAVKTGDSRAKVTSHNPVLGAGRFGSSFLDRARLPQKRGCKLGVLPLTAQFSKV